MKKRKNYQISIFIIACILINYIGKGVAERLELPLWLDSFGTVLTAYTLGPICGAIVGAAVNIIYGFSSYVSYIYALTNIAVGITIGLLVRKKPIDNLFRALSVSFIVTMVSVIISTPLNYFFFDGMTGNKWGDGVIGFLQGFGCPQVISYIIGEFYVDFLDKVVTILLLFILLCVADRKKDAAKKKKRNQLLSVLMGLFIFSGIFAYPNAAIAAPDSATVEVVTDYNTYVQTVYNGENGLPGGAANDIEQTKDGILWIGTYSGLYRFNGNEFKLMDEFESVKNVNCLYTDEEGRLWIGTNDSGLSICINENISNVVGKEDGLPANSVRCITKSSEGNYYVGTTDALSILTLSGGLSVYHTIPQIVYANSISADRNGNVAVVNDDGGLYMLNGTEIVAQITENNYTCCEFDEAGLLYVGNTANLIEVYEVIDGKLSKLKEIVCDGLVNLKSINCEEYGMLFICADNGAGYLDMNACYSSINTNQFNSSIDHMLVDYQGNLWFTSSRRGLLRICETVFMDVNNEIDMIPQVVNTIMEWNNCLYFGTDSGLDMYNRVAGCCQTNVLTEAFQGARIRCLQVDSKGHLWICTSGNGVCEVLPDYTIKEYGSTQGALGDKFRTSLELEDGVMAVAGDFGITYIKDGIVTGTVGYEEGLTNTKVLTLYEAEDGSLLAGTDGSGIAVIKDGKVHKILKKEDNLGSEVILRMIADTENDGLFIVTSNSLSYMNKNGEIRVLDNFPYYNNYDIVEGNQNELFVWGSSGVYVVDKEVLLSGKTVEYELLDSKKGLKKGLTPNSWNYLDEADNLYLSCDTGVVRLNLNRYDRTERSYRMFLKTIQVDDEKYYINRGETTSVPRGANRIELIPEVINYSLNDPYVSVYLEGFDAEPTIVRQSELKSLVYTNLPTGEYVFHLAVLDNKGTQTIAESTFQITKEKEIYDHWWFQVYFAVVFVIFIAYLTWLFARTQIQKTINLQRKELELAKRQVQMGDETIFTIAKAVDAKDENTSQHSFRVSEYSVMIAKKLGLDKVACEELRKTALLHDIGKIGIPDRVLNKPSRLDDEEYAIMKSHVTRGYEILKNFTLVNHVVEGALYHHERYDGKGYAKGLKGEDIPLYARIIGIADAFDAMTANRVYRKKLDFDYVLGELEKGKNTQFDGKLVEVMLELIHEGTIDVEKIYETKNVTEDESEGV